MRTIYLDNNATTRPADEVVEAMSEALHSLWANPSSVHRAGIEVRQKVELAREQVCRLINCEPRELVFTSGGTESTNHAIHGSLRAQPGRTVLVTSKIEHSATRETAETLAERRTEVIWLPATSNGLIDRDALEDVLKRRADDIALVSIQWANNETGTVQPVERIGSICREHGVRFHCDGTQWVGKMPADVAALPIDLMTFAPHKFHGPKGIGGLYVRRGLRLRAEIIGGPQERERRGGTENVPGIIGFGVAAELARRWLDNALPASDVTNQKKDLKHRGPQRATEKNNREQFTSPHTQLCAAAPSKFSALRDRFERAVLDQIPDTSVNGAGAERLWNTSNIAFAKLEAEAILLLLSERGVCASAGAACSSGSLDPSPVLLAMGVPPELAHGSIRFSLSRETTDEEIDQALEIIPDVIEKLRKSLAPV